MSDQLSSSRFQVLFGAALHDYEKQTGIVLAKHPLAEQLQNCDSAESVTSILHEQTRAFNEFRGEDKIMEPLKNALSVLDRLSATANLGQDIGLVRPWAPVRFSMSDPHPVEFRTCDSNTHRPRCPAFCMCHLRLCVHLA